MHTLPLPWTRVTVYGTSQELNHLRCIERLGTHSFRFSPTKPLAGSIPSISSSDPSPSMICRSLDGPATLSESIARFRSANIDIPAALRTSAGESSNVTLRRVVGCCGGGGVFDGALRVVITMGAAGAGAVDFCMNDVVVGVTECLRVWPLMVMPLVVGPRNSGGRGMSRRSFRSVTFLRRRLAFSCRRLAHSRSG